MSNNWKEYLKLTDQQIIEIRMAGYSYLRQGHYEKALHFFRALTTLTPDYIYDWQTLGAILLEMGDYNAALEILENALQMDRDHLQTRFNHATTLLMLGYKKPAHSELLRLLACDDNRIASKAEALLIAHFPQNIAVQK